MKFPSLNRLIQGSQKTETVLQFVRGTVSQIINLRDSPNVIDYIGMGLSIRDNYLATFGREIFEFYPEEDGWISLETNGLNATIRQFLLDNYKSLVKVVPIRETDTYRLDIHGIKFGFMGEGKDGSLDDNIFVKCKAVEDLKQAFIFIRDAIWEKYKEKNNTITLISNDDGDTFSFQEDNSSKLIRSKASVKITEKIKKYLDKGVNRSILFYGPPGSGKSNLVKGIADSLNLRCLRFANTPGGMGSNTIISTAEFLQPNLLIIEDVDHIYGDLPMILDKLEILHAMGVMIFATANEAHKLDDAMIRAGRFDEAIEIKKLDEEVIRELVGGDQEIFDVVSEYPAAFIVEVLQRVKVLGKEEALNNLLDIEQRLEKMKSSNYTLIDEDDEN